MEMRSVVHAGDRINYGNNQWFSTKLYIVKIKLDIAGQHYASAHPILGRR